MLFLRSQVHGSKFLYDQANMTINCSTCAIVAGQGVIQSNFSNVVTTLRNVSTVRLYCDKLSVWSFLSDSQLSGGDVRVERSTLLLSNYSTVVVPVSSTTSLAQITIDSGLAAIWTSQNCNISVGNMSIVNSTVLVRGLIASAVLLANNIANSFTFQITQQSLIEVTPYQIGSGFMMQASTLNHILMYLESTRFSVLSKTCSSSTLQNFVQVTSTGSEFRMENRSHVELEAYSAVSSFSVFNTTSADSIRISSSIIQVNSSAPSQVVTSLDNIAAISSGFASFLMASAGKLRGEIFLNDSTVNLVGTVTPMFFLNGAEVKSFQAVCQWSRIKLFPFSIAVGILSYGSGLKQMSFEMNRSNMTAQCPLCTLSTLFGSVLSTFSKSTIRVVECVVTLSSGGVTSLAVTQQGTFQGDLLVQDAKLYLSTTYLPSSTSMSYSDIENIRSNLAAIFAFLDANVSSSTIQLTGTFAEVLASSSFGLSLIDSSAAGLAVKLDGTSIRMSPNRVGAVIVISKGPLFNGSIDVSRSNIAISATSCFLVTFFGALSSRRCTPTFRVTNSTLLLQTNTIFKMGLNDALGLASSGGSVDAMLGIPGSSVAAFLMITDAQYFDMMYYDENATITTRAVASSTFLIINTVGSSVQMAVVNSSWTSQCGVGGYVDFFGLLTGSKTAIGTGAIATNILFTNTGWGSSFWFIAQNSKIMADVVSGIAAANVFWSTFQPSPSVGFHFINSAVVAQYPKLLTDQFTATVANFFFESPSGEFLNLVVQLFNSSLRSQFPTAPQAFSFEGSSNTASLVTISLQANSIVEANGGDVTKSLPCFSISTFSSSSPASLRVLVENSSILLSPNVFDGLLLVAPLLSSVDIQVTNSRVVGTTSPSATVGRSLLRVSSSGSCDFLQQFIVEVNGSEINGFDALLQELFSSSSCAETPFRRTTAIIDSSVTLPVRSSCSAIPFVTLTCFTIECEFLAMSSRFTLSSLGCRNTGGLLALTPSTSAMLANWTVQLSENRYANVQIIHPSSTLRSDYDFISLYCEQVQNANIPTLFNTVNKPRLRQQVNGSYFAPYVNYVPYSLRNKSFFCDYSESISMSVTASRGPTNTIPLSTSGTKSLNISESSTEHLTLTETIIPPTKSDSLYIAARPCPENINITVYPVAQSITDTLFRTAAVEFLIRLPPPIRWANAPFGTVDHYYIHFEVLSKFQPQGFQRYWNWFLVDDSMRSTWRFSGSTNYDSLIIKLPPSTEQSHLELLLPEVVSVAIDPRALQFQCTPLGSSNLLARAIFTITPNSMSSLIEVNSRAADFLSLAALFDLSPDMQMLKLLASSKCSPAIQDGSSGDFSKYLISPFYDFGQTAMVFGNIGVIVAVMALQLLGAAFVRGFLKRKIEEEVNNSSRTDPSEKPTNDQEPSIIPYDLIASWAKVKFPGVTYTVFLLMMCGISLGSIQLAVDGSGSLNWVPLVVSILFTAAFVKLLMRLYHVPNALIEQGEVSSNAPHRTPYPRFMPYKSLESWTPFAKFFVPRGYWGYEEQSAMFGPVVGAMNYPFRHYGWYPTAVFVITCFITMIDVCAAQYYVNGTILLLVGLGEVFLRPHRISVISVFVGVTRIATGVLCFITGKSLSSSTNTLHVLQLFITSSLYIVKIIQIVHKVAIFLSERFLWKKAAFSLLDLVLNVLGEDTGGQGDPAETSAVVQVTAEKGPTLREIMARVGQQKRQTVEVNNGSDEEESSEEEEEILHRPPPKPPVYRPPRLATQVAADLVFCNTEICRELRSISRAYQLGPPESYEEQMQRLTSVLLLASLNGTKASLQHEAMHVDQPLL